MLFSYGDGKFIEKDKVFEGKIILSEHKLYLKINNDDLAQTFVPLEKIERVVQKGARAYFHVRQSLHFQYETCFEGEIKFIDELVKDIVKRRGLKKKFLRKEWVETPC